jgi:hypothetical protein
MMGRDMVIHTVTKCDLNAMRVVSVYRRRRARLAAGEVIDFDVLIAETAKAASIPPERFIRSCSNGLKCGRSVI